MFLAGNAANDLSVKHFMQILKYKWLVLSVVKHILRPRKCGELSKGHMERDNIIIEIEKKIPSFWKVKFAKEVLKLKSVVIELRVEVLLLLWKRIM